MLNNTILEVIYLISSVFPGISRGKDMVLCYHAVDDSGWEFSTFPKQFELQLVRLKKKYKLVSLDEMLTHESKKCRISVTFDDGYESFITNALPVLYKHKIPVTLFLVGDKKLVNRRMLQNNSGLFDITTAYQFLQDVEIGYHSRSHTDLTKLKMKQLEKEVGKAKELSKKYKLLIKYFAYPFGFYNNRVMNAVRKAGYKAAFTTNTGFLKKENSWDIPRYCVGNNLSIDAFLGSVTPIGAFYQKMLFKIYIGLKKIGLL